MDNLKSQVNLDQFTTFHIGGPAKYFVTVTNIEEAKQALVWAMQNKEKVLFLGGGSNMLMSDQGFAGLVIKNNLLGVTEKIIDGSTVLVTAKSGELWDDLVEYTVNRDYWGIENLSYIPGTVGASPVQNIGAYGVELKDVFVSLEAINADTLELETFGLDACQFDYRYSVFKGDLKNKYFITSVTLRLSLSAQPKLDYGSLKERLMDINNVDARIISREIKKIRQEKLPNPDERGNAGSFFKNPVISREQFLSLQQKYLDIKSYDLPSGEVKVPAGWLIEKSGWKGKSLGQAAVWDKQALVLVNLGQAKCVDIQNLADTIIKDVNNKFGISLQTEVNIFNN